MTSDGHCIFQLIHHAIFEFITAKVPDSRDQRFRCLIRRWPQDFGATASSACFEILLSTERL